MRDERNQAREETLSIRAALDEAHVRVFKARDPFLGEMKRARNQKREVDPELARAKSALH